MRVKAKAKGSYGGLRAVGEIFVLEEKKTADGDTISTEDQFSAKWMVKVDADGNEISEDTKKAPAKKTRKKAPAKKPAPEKEPEDEGTDEGTDDPDVDDEGADEDADAGDDEGDDADDAPAEEEKPQGRNRRRRNRG